MRHNLEGIPDKGFRGKTRITKGKDLNKLVCRGQVWWIDEIISETNRSLGNKDNHVQAKSRPWLIVSCRESNERSLIVNCVPISTGRVDKYPMHVFFTHKNRLQVVQCEQIRTFNKYELRDYMYSLKKDLMLKVDRALMSQLGLFKQSNKFNAYLGGFDR